MYTGNNLDNYIGQRKIDIDVIVIITSKKKHLLVNEKRGCRDG